MKRITSLIISALTLLSSCSDHDDIQAVYYGELLETTPGMGSVHDYFPYDTFDFLPHQETIEDTLIFTGTGVCTKHSYYTLTMNERSSKLDIEINRDGDSIFTRYKKIKKIYDVGTYKTKDNSEIEVTKDGIYIKTDNGKELAWKLSNYSVTTFSETREEESRPINDNTKVQLNCTDNSLHFVGEKMEYKAIINENTCILKELTPEQDEFELEKVSSTGGRKY